MNEKPESKLPAVSFIGTGTMGAPLAAHLLHAGYSLTVYNRSPQKAHGLVSNGAHWAKDLGTAVHEATVVFTMLPAAEEVDQVYFGTGGLLEQAKPGTFLVDLSSSSVELARSIHSAAKQRGLGALDSPVSGGQKAAMEARLSLFSAGDPKDFEILRPVLSVFGTPRYMGPPGNGQLCKLSNQIALASTMMGVCESLSFMIKSGIDPEKALQGMFQGAASSWALEHLSAKILKDELKHGLCVKHFIKDLTQAQNTARSLGLDFPGLEKSLELYRRLCSSAGEELGIQALYLVYARHPEGSSLDDSFACLHLDTPRPLAALGGLVKPEGGGQ